jgi:hypothetical protein
MDIRTSQDVTAIGCCSCLPDACEAPRRECQSKQVTQLAVGWSISTWRSAVGIGWDEDFEDTIPCPDYVRTYRNVSQEQTQTSSDPESEPFSQSLESAVNAGAVYNVFGYPSPTTEVGSVFTVSLIDTYGGGVYSGSYTVEYEEFTDTITASITFTDPVDAPSLISETAEKLDDEEWGPATTCGSSASLAYLSCRGVATEEPHSAIVTLARYRIGIPAGERWDATSAAWLAWDAADPETRGDEPPVTTFDVAHAAWVIAHAEWTAADEDERGDEPIEPTRRTTYEWQGDEVFFPTEWSAWRALQDAFDAATAAHEIWEDAEDDEERGDEPEIPDDPGAEPSGPTLTASRSWVYDGSDEWSEWFEIAIPDGPGETRVVNQLVICYRSASLGQKPTAHGEVYEF